MTIRQAQLAGAQMYQIDLSFFERILERYHRRKMHDSFKEAICKYVDGPPFFYRLDEDEEPQELTEYNRCEDEKGKTLTERPVRALVACHPLEIQDGKKVDGYFELWYTRHSDWYINTDICFELSVARGEQLRRVTRKPKSIDEWIRSRTDSRDITPEGYVWFMNNAALKTYKGLSKEHSIRESEDGRLNDLLYTVFFAMRKTNSGELRNGYIRDFGEPDYSDALLTHEKRLRQAVSGAFRRALS
jgi:hypothetical protein